MRGVTWIDLDGGFLQLVLVQVLKNLVPFHRKKIKIKFCDLDLGFLC